MMETKMRYDKNWDNNNNNNNNNVFILLNEEQCHSQPYPCSTDGSDGAKMDFEAPLLALSKALAEINAFSK